MRTSVWALMSLLALGACERLLEVELPTRVPASTLDDPTLAPTLVQGSVADFECAFANYVLGTGGIAGEWFNAGSTPRFWSLRQIGNQGSWVTLGCVKDGVYFFGLYTPLSTARFQADQAFRLIESFADTAVPGGPVEKTKLLATAAAYAGYSYALFGEGFCEAAFDTSRALLPAEVLDTAEQRFTTAIHLAESVGTDSILNMALEGRARVRLDLGRTAEAAADARRVDSGFVKYATYSAANERRWNRLWDFNYNIGAVSIHPEYRDLEVDGVADARVRVIDAGRVGDNGRTPLWQQTKYTSESSPIVIASWVEAQLIIAEVEGGQEAVARINALRARPGVALPPFASSDPVAISNQVIEERRRELFLEGHRINDLLRLGLPFPSGLDPNGDLIGSTTCLPLPLLERCANPNIGCE